MLFSSLFDVGALNLTKSEDPTDFTREEKDTVNRFAAAFEFAYNRFRELQEKEDQNRELTIQNAIERVRAQAQGMGLTGGISLRYF